MINGLKIVLKWKREFTNEGGLATVDVSYVKGRTDQDDCFEMTPRIAEAKVFLTASEALAWVQREVARNVRDNKTIHTNSGLELVAVRDVISFQEVESL